MSVGFGTLASLPIVETLLYNTHVANGRLSLSPREYVELTLLSVLLVSLMVLSFVLQEDQFRRQLEDQRERLSGIRRRLRENLPYALMAFPILFLILFFGGRTAERIFLATSAVQAAATPIVLLAVVVLMIRLIGRLLAALATQSEHLKGAMDAWAFSLKVSTLFYVLLVASTLRLVGLDGIREGARVEFRLGVAKDYFLLFVIASMLYAGLLKIAHANSLVELFQTHSGFYQFMVVYGVIAILATWADFNGISPLNQERIFLEDWQHRFNTVHVYVRDIFLLLIPIGGLLFWSVRRIGEENHAKRGAGRRYPSE